MKAVSNSISVYSSTEAVLTSVKDNIRMSPWVRSIVIISAANYSDDSKFLNDLQEAGNKNPVLIYDLHKTYSSNDIQMLKKIPSVTYANKHDQVKQFVSIRQSGQ